MSFYLCNAIGFFIQLFPCTLMIFFPFPEDGYRFRRKKIFTGMAIASAVLALIFPAVIYVSLTAHPDRDAGGPANLYMLAAILLALAAYVWLVREMLIKKFMVFFSVLFYEAAQYWLVNMLVTPLSGTSLYQPVAVYNLIDVLLYLVTAAILLPIEFFAVIRPLEDFNREIRPGTMKREFLVAILSTAICFVLMAYCSTIWRTIFRWSVTHLLWLLPVSLFLIIDQAVIYWLVFRESIRRQRDSERQRFLEVQHLQYEKIAGEIENTRRLRHDLHHHLNTLGALNAQGKQTEITEYLGQYGAVYDKLNEQKFSGDPVVDSILEYYLALAYDESIPVGCQITLKKRSGVDPVDMTVLLGNCLENAFEALRQLPENERRLSIEMMPAKAMLVLRIQNTCSDTQDSTGPTGWEAFVSQKGAEHTGVGLRSIAVIAEKYGGNVQFQRKKGVFTTRVILNPVQVREDGGTAQ